jgi:hypothetical protein
MSKTPSEFNLEAIAQGQLTGDMIERLVREFQERKGLVVDGKAGPATRSALEMTLATAAATSSSRASTWQFWDGPMELQPTDRQGVYQVFGNPGVGKEDTAWTKKNIVKAVIPGCPKPLWVNRLIEPYYREAIRRVQVAEPSFKILTCAAHVFRHTRHDPSLPLSNHSWGIALDFNPADNKAITFKKGEAPKAWTPEWYKVYPRGACTVTPAVVEAMSSCGFAWGSDWDEDGDTSDHTFCDPMHFEWVARDGKNKLV